MTVITLLYSECDRKLFTYLVHTFCLQCFDTVSWAAVCKKLEWWGTGMVICLERDADLHIWPS